MMQKIWVTLALFGILGFLPSAVVAQDQEAQKTEPEKLTAKSWVERLRKEKKLKTAATGLFPARILFIEELPEKGDPVFADISTEDFDKIGFLKATPEEELKYFFALNKKPRNLQTKNDQHPFSSDRWLSILLDASEADSILWMHKKGEWTLFQKKDGKPQIIISKPSASDRSAEGVHKWLLSALGYEGVIIDRKDNLFLVGNLANITKKDTQALLLKNSTDKFTMALAKKEGNGLLQLTNQDGGFAIFELLLGDNPKSIPIGTKIAIENSEQGKKKKNNFKKEKAPVTEPKETTESPADDDGANAAPEE